MGHDNPWRPNTDMDTSQLEWPFRCSGKANLGRSIGAAKTLNLLRTYINMYWAAWSSQWVKTLRAPGADYLGPVRQPLFFKVTLKIPLKPLSLLAI